MLHAAGVLRIDHLPPLHGHFRVPSAALLPPLAFAVLAVAVLPVLATRLRFGAALLVAYGAALAWAVLLASSGEGLAWPFTHRQEYLAVLPVVGDDPLGWLASFTERLPAYPTHVRGHPPLPVLVLWTLARAGLPGPLPAALLAVATGCSATVAVALAVRRLAGEETARRALPYLALTPAAVWIATTMDAFFAGVGAWGVALLVYGGARGTAGTRRGETVTAGTEAAGTWRDGNRETAGTSPDEVRRTSGAAGASRGGTRAVTGALCGGAAGVLLGALPYLSYGLVPYLLVPVAAAVAVRITRVVAVACLAGAAAVTAAFAAGGFLWPAGVAATHAEWAADPGAARPYLYFLVANLAVLALLTGPATAAGLAVLAGRAATVTTPVTGATPVTGGGWFPRGLISMTGPARWSRDRIGVPVAAAAVAVLALDVSGVTRGEVERIWVPYAIWISLAAAVVPGRRWLAAQAAAGLLLQGLVLSPW
ncbi:hypothetical protein AB0D67_35455 [Streptosporangium sp. NPDC048047]|uniref:hypothetical protein n=1 Tax=Streptosporangium sp. NPDC048047 TaxID=3155748 RepID=UPI00341DA431